MAVSPGTTLVAEPLLLFLERTLSQPIGSTVAFISAD